MITVFIEYHENGGIRLLRNVDTHYQPTGRHIIEDSNLMFTAVRSSKHQVAMSSVYITDIPESSSQNAYLHAL
jgi:hypothetical protein